MERKDMTDAEVPEAAEPVPTAESVVSAKGVSRDAAGPAQQERVLLHMPVEVRSVALVVIAVLVSAFALQWARDVFIPILVGVMFSYALTPIVNALEKWHVPRAAGAAVVLLTFVGALGWGTWNLSDEASALVETLPNVAVKLREAVQRQRQKPAATIEKVQQAATEIERVAENAGQPASAAPGDLAVSSAAASSSTVGAATPLSDRRPSRQARAASHPLPETTTQTRQVTRVVVEKPGFDIKGLLWSGTLGAFAFLGQCAIVLFITFFLLASGDTFRRKMVKLAGPRLSQKRITIQALDEITDQIQRYLLLQAAVSILVGVLTWLAFWAIGLEQSAVWGVVAGITNLIPYLGAVLIGGASALVAFIQFGAIDMGLLVGVSSFAIHTVVGNLLTPWWMGRASSMSPFAVFVSVLVFGWLWGIWGLLLGVPILMVVKAICDRVDELNAIGELLGA